MIYCPVAFTLASCLVVWTPHHLLCMPVFVLVAGAHVTLFFPSLFYFFFVAMVALSVHRQQGVDRLESCARAGSLCVGFALCGQCHRVQQVVQLGYVRSLFTRCVVFCLGAVCAKKSKPRGHVCPGVAFSDAMTPSKCGTGQNGETRNEEIVTVESCAVNPLLLQPFTPFAVNVMPLSTCKSYGCGTDQCLEARTPCVNGVHGNSTTHVCVDQESMSSTAPLSLFFHLVVAVLGIVVFFRFGQRGSVAVCGWQRQRPNMSARSHSRRGRAWHSDDFGSRGADGKDAASARMLSGTMDSRDGSFGNSSLPQS